MTARIARAVSFALIALVAVLAAATVGPSSAARDDDAARALDALLEPIREKHGVPAMGGAIVGLDGALAVGATGVRRHGKDTAVSADDLWHIGSCTKSMTATLVARMVERGDLAWDTPLEKAFPKLAKTMHADWRSVPLDLLLANRGGAPGDLNARGLWFRLAARKGTPRDQRRELVEGVLPHPPAATPGSQFIYSNAGFAIAGAAAETKAKRPWEDLLRTELFEPLGMQGAGFGAPGNPKRLDQPWGHRPSGAGPVPIPPGPGADNPPAIGPAGTVHCSLADWARYVALHLRGAAGKKKQLLRPETFEKLHTPPDGQDYALGWIVTKRPWAAPEGQEEPGRAIWHNGSNTMWYAVAWLAPERAFAVLVTSNVGGANASKACDEAAGALIQHHLRRAR